MIYIDPRKIEQQIPEIMKQSLRDSTTALRQLATEQRRDYINTHDQQWKDLRPYLASVLGKGNSQKDFKCWYCEDKTARFTYHIDHFRPKGRVQNRNASAEPGYWWLAFAWENYRLSCEYCNSPHTDADDVVGRLEAFLDRVPRAHRWARDPRVHSVE